MGLENQGSIRDLNCMLSGDNLAVEYHNTTIQKNLLVKRVLQREDFS